MFNSQILDVAIGIIFVYLLLSLICSAANEIIEIALKKRAIDLERGIRELLVPGKSRWLVKRTDDDIVQKLYNHPLINGLFGGFYESSRIRNPLRYIWRTKLPTYIPSRNFALALMDLILPGTQIPPPPKSPSASPPASAPAPPSGLSGAAGAAPASFDVKLDKVPDPPKAPDPGSSLRELRDQVVTTNLLKAAPQARKALITLIDAAGNDAARARQNIEDWFNASMDRVSGWYKRRAQIFILIIGFVVVVWLNGDSIAIVRALNSDKALRELTVAEATKYLEAATSPSPTPPQSPPQSPSSTPTSSPSATPTPECPTPACDKDKNSAECKLQQNKCQLKELGLPLGWNSPDDARRQMPKNWDDVYKQVRWHLLGWLLTALAISLGAPFWFDILNKFIVIRSTVKPKEKSPEEKSKD